MLRSLVACAALTAAALTPGAPGAQAQTRQYDGYCYVRSDDMATNPATAPCLNGEYYVYTDSYRAAPRAPRGYQVEYFTRRPSHELYSQVYNASTLTANFDPGASNHFGAGDGGYAYNNGSERYADRRYDQPYSQPYNQTYNPSYNQDDYSDTQPGAVSSERVTGWRDDRGQWHIGQPSAFGWRDDSGRWHVGQLSTYGWQDDQGQWHEQARGDASNSGY
jgi:hypothetical protein